jgi:hypothetical protein
MRWPLAARGSMQSLRLAKNEIGVVILTKQFDIRFEFVQLTIIDGVYLQTGTLNDMSPLLHCPCPQNMHIENTEMCAAP